MTAATASINSNLTPPSSSSYPDDLFSQFAFRGSSRSRCPSKSSQQNPTSQDFTQNTTILIPQHSPIATREDLQASEPKNHQNKSLSREIPICPFQEIPISSPSSDVYEPPILTLEDLQNAKPALQPPKKPPLARRILNFYREFGFDQKIAQPTSHSVLNSEPVQEGARMASRYFQNSKSTQQGERFVSRYFQKSVKKRVAHNEDEDEDVNLTEQPSKRSSKRRRKDVDPSSDNSKTNQHSMGKASRSIQKSGTDKRVRIVSRYFQNSEKNIEVDREATKQINQRAKSGKRVRKPVNERKQRDKTSSSKPRTTLTAAELSLEAYRRKSSDDTWKPPPSGIRLLQQDHAYDPWRVLVICMLLNRTSGQQNLEGQKPRIN
ncbi:uncharacterized protein LOC120081563 isoform X2 [Benincasa hispida]|uniref:uncharacterized protein LOC120081563 isoform X2 n=1 Tax=Benincasa hispida TaxID=102211 RepID=UPI0019006D90|nr:uncharacterized protein LOC120081563 isoform X2 [Benincasa hispida]